MYQWKKVDTFMVSYCIYGLNTRALKRNCRHLDQFWSLAAREVVILTNSSATSDEKIIKMNTVPFKCGQAMVCYTEELAINMYDMAKVVI